MSSRPGDVLAPRSVPLPASNAVAGAGHGERTAPGMPSVGVPQRTLRQTSSARKTTDVDRFLSVVQWTLGMTHAGAPSLAPTHLRRPDGLRWDQRLRRAWFYVCRRVALVRRHDPRVRALAALPRLNALVHHLQGILRGTNEQHALLLHHRPTDHRQPQVTATLYRPPRPSYVGRRPRQAFVTVLTDWRSAARRLGRPGSGRPVRRRSRRSVPSGVAATSNSSRTRGSGGIITLEQEHSGHVRPRPRQIASGHRTRALSLPRASGLEFLLIGIASLPTATASRLRQVRGLAEGDFDSAAQVPGADDRGPDPVPGSGRRMQFLQDLGLKDHHRPGSGDGFVRDQEVDQRLAGRHRRHRAHIVVSRHSRWRRGRQLQVRARRAAVRLLRRRLLGLLAALALAGGQLAPFGGPDRRGLRPAPYSSLLLPLLEPPPRPRACPVTPRARRRSSSTSLPFYLVESLGVPRFTTSSRAATTWRPTTAQRPRRGDRRHRLRRRPDERSP